MSQNTIETRVLLASRYVAGATDRSKTHAFDVEGDELSLCRRVSLVGAADVHAQDPNEAPTCATCLKRDPRAR